MRPIIIIACVLVCSTAAFAEDNPFEGFDIDVPAQSEAGDPAGDEAGARAAASQWDRAESTLEGLAERVARLERESIDAEEARKIANEVVDDRIAELKLAIRKPDGGQRVESVSLSGQAPTAGIQLNPGETLLGYTDAATGQYVRVQPSRSVHSSAGTYSVTETKPATIYQAERRGLFGRRVVLRARSRPEGSATSGTCRVVQTPNGPVRVCN